MRSHTYAEILCDETPQSASDIFFYFMGNISQGCCSTKLKSKAFELKTFKGVLRSFRKNLSSQIIKWPRTCSPNENHATRKKIHATRKRIMNAKKDHAIRIRLTAHAKTFSASYKKTWLKCLLLLCTRILLFHKSFCDCYSDVNFCIFT
jgi:hypothetical protein